MSDTGPARLPGLHRLMTSDTGLSTWAERVNEHLEVRSGARGNELEKSATQRDIKMLLDKIAALEKKIPTTTVVDSEYGTTVTTTTVAAPAAKDYSPDIAALRAKNDALQRRIIQLEARSQVSASGYSAGFLQETTNDQLRPNKWAINGTVRWGQTTFTDGFNLLRNVFTESGPNSLLDGKPTPTINGNLTITGANGASSGEKTLQGFANRTSADIAALSNRFDGAGRLTWGHMPQWAVPNTTSMFNVDFVLTIVYARLEYLKTHTGYGGPW